MVKNFLFSMLSRQVLGPTQTPIQWVPGALSPGVKRQGRETDHSPPTTVEVKKMWIYISSAHTPSWRSAYLSTGTNLLFTSTHPRLISWQAGISNLN
jgi:hypothetical protein